MLLIFQGRLIRQQNDSQSEKHDGVSLQDFSVQKDNPIILLGGHGKKRRFYGANCRTRVCKSLPLRKIFSLTAAATSGFASKYSDSLNKLLIIMGFSVSVSN